MTHFILKIMNRLFKASNQAEKVLSMTDLHREQSSIARFWSHPTWQACADAGDHPHSEVCAPSEVEINDRREWVETEWARRRKEALAPGGVAYNANVQLTHILAMRTAANKIFAAVAEMSNAVSAPPNMEAFKELDDRD